ncbi:hypothetical protein AMECASPLE_006442 [Ameca splendens]|uniref:Uncharacterized protein n=1 Tax=Ameca splendens TaxID=208324 RepID=A0ABV0ZJP2_9TELE
MAQMCQGANYPTGLQQKFDQLPNHALWVEDLEIVLQTASQSLDATPASRMDDKNVKKQPHGFLRGRRAQAGTFLHCGNKSRVAVKSHLVRKTEKVFNNRETWIPADSCIRLGEE